MYNRVFSLIIACILWCAATVTCIAADGAKGNTSEEMDRLIAQMQKIHDVLQSNSFKNVAYDFSMVETEKKGTDAHALLMAWGVGRLWLPWQPDPRVKLHYSPYTTVWRHGEETYLQEDTTYAYNGDYWIVVKNKAGSVSDMMTVNDAEITGTCLADFVGHSSMTGEEFLISHHLFSKEPLAEYLEPFLNISKGSKWSGEDPTKLMKITNDGDLCKMSSWYPADNPKQIREVTLNMAKGGALKEWKESFMNSSSQIWNCWDYLVEDYTKAGGVWFPCKARSILSQDVDVSELRWSAWNFSVMDDSKDLYEVPLKAGTWVMDRRDRSSYLVKGESGKTTETGQVQKGTGGGR